MASTIVAIFLLLVLFQIKHFLADFLLQSRHMVSGKALQGWAFIRPLAIHAGVHGGLTLLLLLVFSPKLWFLALVDFAVHFVIDRLKAAPAFFGRFSDQSKRPFWVLFGADQLAHHLTHYALIWIIISHSASSG